ncbi:hypothetical protein M408DRAFT_325340 [Serendipita vermifera MAFF 305830]|uniref:RING-type domain-containing protein n=1 Tax=Serendipita vermifera MAFF 305830 TaxID=933852 RepID=A0A0C3BQM0_SERVB|nr:hypothetical protein M408DRAFT_325340 [Serendipita vermifera MAFF 305830]
MVRRRQTFTSINPALFLTQALRTLEDARKLENNGNQTDTTSAFQLYLTLVQTYQTVFGVPGASGQDRIRPLNDKHLILQLAHVARDAAEGFNRTHEALPIHLAVNVRSGYYPSPSYPCDVGMAIAWLESKASFMFQDAADLLPTTAGEMQKGKGRVLKTLSAGPSTSQAPVLPTIPVTTPSPVPLGDCAVCASPFTTSESLSASDVVLPKRAPTSQCTHPASVCKSCLAETISAHLEANGAARAVPCPHADCPASLSRDDVREWATEGIFARWDMLSLRELMRIDASANPDAGLFVWCANVSCYSGQIEKNSGCRHMSCRCGYHFTWWYAPIHWRRFTPFIRARDPRL